MALCLAYLSDGVSFGLHSLEQYRTFLVCFPQAGQSCHLELVLVLRGFNMLECVAQQEFEQNFF